MMPKVEEAETTPVALVTMTPLGALEIVRFVVEAVPKYPVPETAMAVDEAKLAVSFDPLKLRDEFNSVSRVPSKYGMEFAAQVVVPVPPFPVVSAVASVSAPVEENEEVAVAPKYALLYTERMVEDAPPVNW